MIKYVIKSVDGVLSNEYFVEFSYIVKEQILRIHQTGKLGTNIEKIESIIYKNVFDYYIPITYSI